MISKTEGAFGDYELDEISKIALKAKKDRSVIPILWENVYKRVVGFCNKFWSETPSIKARCELDDLIQESYLFFETAIQKYQPDRGAQFGTYLYLHLRTACISASGGRTKRQRSDPIFSCESLDAPIKEGEDATIVEMIADDTSSQMFENSNETDAVRMILREVEKVNGGMNRYCFLEYAYRDHSMSEIARKVHISNTAVRKHIQIAARQLRISPVIKNAYPERYERSRYYIQDNASKGLDAFFASGTSIVEDIINRKLKIDRMFDKDAEMEKKYVKEKRSKNKT